MLEVTRFCKQSDVPRCKFHIGLGRTGRFSVGFQKGTSGRPLDDVHVF